MPAQKSKRPAVCLFAFHPLLGSEFVRLLPEKEFRLFLRRVDPDRVSDPGGLQMPRASVYAVEAHSQGGTTGALIRTILTLQPAARVIVVAEAFEESDVFPLLRLGVKGLLRYVEVEDQLSRALRVIATSGFWVPRALLSRFVEWTVASAPRPARDFPSTRRLSKREREVLALLLDNLANKEIAAELHISSRTAKFHVSNLLAKHGVRRRAHLIVLAHTAAMSESRTPPDSAT